MTKIKRLSAALREAYVDIAWNAYCYGHVSRDGMFDNMCMSDPEWLQRAVTGCSKRTNTVPAEWLKAQIDDLADLMVNAVITGTAPFDVTLGRTP